MLRGTQGKTICNQVLKLALEMRARQLEEELTRVQNNAIRISSLQSRIKGLRPKRCIIGLLFFGLQHTIVQDQAAAALHPEQQSSHDEVTAAPLPQPSMFTSAFCDFVDVLPSQNEGSSFDCTWNSEVS